MVGWPVAVWVLLLAAAAFVAEYIVLLVRKRRSAPEGAAAQRRLAHVATTLKAYAGAHLQALPDSLQELGLPDTDGVAYRPLSRLNLDERLILVHDARPVQKVVEFPRLRDGRAIVFCSGRLLVVTEEAFEKLARADDGLRERLHQTPLADMHDERSARDVSRG